MQGEAILICTGVIVSKDCVNVRNKHHKAIYTLFNDMNLAESDEALKAIHEELMGRLNAAGQIDKAFKQRARNILLQRS